MSDTTTALNLSKGQRVDLTKTNPSLKVAHVGLGWDVREKTSDSDPDFDLDAFAILLSGGKMPGANSVVYFNNTNLPGVTHSGDNLTGQGDGDDETIKIRFDTVAPTIDEILVAVNIYQAPMRKQNFGMVDNAFIRIYDGETGQEILKYDLTEDNSGFTGFILGKVYKKDGEWRFQAVGKGVNGDINEIAAAYH